jgi:hypothetical protein
MAELHFEFHREADLTQLSRLQAPRGRDHFPGGSKPAAREGRYILSSAASKQTLLEARAINAAGHIVGSLRTNGRVNEIHDYLLTKKL